jgi:cAMP-dependent protein kinase regulator
MGCGASKEEVVADNSITAQYAKQTDKVIKPKRPPAEQPVEKQTLKDRDTSTQESDLPLKLISEPSLGFPSSVALYDCGCHNKNDDSDDDDDEEEDEEPAPARQPKRPTAVRQPSDGHVHVPSNPPKRKISNNNNKKRNKISNNNNKKRNTNNKAMDGSTHHLRNIFAAPFTAYQVASFQAPTFEKSDFERSYIKKALEKNFIFSALGERQMDTILNAFDRVKYKHGNGPIIRQGDDGDYFYVIRRGLLHYEVDGIFVGNASAGQTFGELALIYTSPRAASVVPDSDVVLYRVDQSTFRYILQTHTEQTEKDKRALLEGIPFLKDLDSVDLEKLAAAMVPRKFMQGENIARKGEDDNAFYVIEEGKIRVKGLEIGGTTYEDHDLGPGSFFGESNLLGSAPRAAHFVGKTDGFTLWIDKETFTQVLGDYEKLITKSADKKRLVRAYSMSISSNGTLGLTFLKYRTGTFRVGSALFKTAIYPQRHFPGWRLP